MALFSINNINISGISATVPENVYDNNTYDWIDENSRKMFIKTTGVKTRHFAPPGLTTGDLCRNSTEELIKSLSWKKDGIGILVFVSQSRDFLLPATACILQNSLQLSTSCLAFDINMGCSGYVYGLSVISAIMSATGIKKGLLLAGDISTLNVSYKDKSTFPLFGDAGTCTAVEFCQGKKMFYNLQTDGSGYEAIIIRDGGFRNFASKESFDYTKYEEGIERNKIQLELNGLEVFNFSLREVSPNVQELLEYSRKTIGEIDYFVFHQANKLINESIRRKLKIPPEKMPSSIERYGNTSSASIPLTIVTELKNELLNKKKTLLMSGFGVGLSWGSILTESENIICPDLFKISK